MEIKGRTGQPVFLELIELELILSIIFFILGHLINNAYIRGVGVGLIISWVTSALAYFITKSKIK